MNRTEEATLKKLVQDGVSAATISDIMNVPLRTVYYHMKKIKEEPKTLLFISDMQIPYHHTDSLPFLKAVKDKYKPDEVYNVGDLIDSHTLSFHEVDPDLAGPRDEIEISKKYIKELADIFPDMKIALGNHDIRLFRKAKQAGIPKECIRSIHEILGCPTGWEFSDMFHFRLPNGDPVLMIHNCGNRDATKGVLAYGASIVQGHHHTEATVQYVSTHDKLMFGMTVGSLIDDKALAFEYNKLHIKRPIISVGLIENSIPRILPMRLNMNGRWDGNVN